MIKSWHERALELAYMGMAHDLVGMYKIMKNEGYKVPSKKAIGVYLGRCRKKYGQDAYAKALNAMECEYEELELKENMFQESKKVAVEKTEPSVHDNNWDGNTVITFGLIGDTHMGSKYAQMTYLNNFYDICKERGITSIYHAGDISEGIKMRPGHEYELYTISADDMKDNIVNKYPKREGINTYFITGNHDSSIYKHVGYNIGKAIANDRPDMIYLGRDSAVVYLTPNCTLELRHPWDGTAYSLSYKPQKMIEAMEADSKPNILAIGHYHKASYMFYRNVHCFQTGCFQGQTPFTRGKGISVHLGGWIITVKVNSEGHIQSISQEYIPYYSNIKDDYKKYI